MSTSSRSAFSLLLVILCVLGLNSCLWTRVSTHTLTDAIGKEEFVGKSFNKQKSAGIYQKNGIYYLRHTFYKVPARGKLCTYTVLAKGGCNNHVYLSDEVEYQEGMEQVYLYSALDKQTLKTLLPKARYKEHAEREFVLPQSAFEGNEPVAVITDYTKLSHLYGLGGVHIPPERSAANYAMMPLTGALYVADIPLSIGVTAAGWLGVNAPLVIYAMFDIAVESIK